MSHQCPLCQLRYLYRTELEFHMREDHDVPPRRLTPPPRKEPVKVGGSNRSA